MKLFAGLHVLAPREWMDALREPRHHQQCHLIVIAKDKAHAQQMLTARTSPGQAYHLTRSLRLCREFSTPDQVLLDAGIIHQDLAGVFIYYEPIMDMPVLLVQPDHTYPVAGHFRRGAGLADKLYAEKS